MTEENKEGGIMETTIVIPDYKALYFELLEAMESIGLNIAVQARNAKQQAKANERPKQV